MKQHRIAQILLGLCLALLFLSAAVTFTLNFRPLYVHDLRALDLPGQSGMSEALILEQYDALIGYNDLGGPEELVFPDLPSSENALTHFAQVRTIFLGFQVLLLVTLVLSVTGILLLRRKRPLYLVSAGVFSLVPPIALGFAVATAWDKLFVVFHELVFRNDLWIFSSQTDPIIDLLPDEFFMHCAVMILGLFLGLGTVCLLIWGIWGRRAGPRRAKTARS